MADKIKAGINPTNGSIALFRTKSYLPALKLIQTANKEKIDNATESKMKWPAKVPTMPPSILRVRALFSSRINTVTQKQITGATTHEKLANIATTNAFCFSISFLPIAKKTRNTKKIAADKTPNKNKAMTIFFCF